MSYYDYRASLEIASHDYPFAALIMAAVRKADSDNHYALATAFPEIWQELRVRYHARGLAGPDGRLLRPAGLLPDEPWHAEAAPDEAPA